MAGPRGCGKTTIAFHCGCACASKRIAPFRFQTQPPPAPPLPPPTDAPTDTTATTATSESRGVVLQQQSLVPQPQPQQTERNVVRSEAFGRLANVVFFCDRKQLEASPPLPCIDQKSPSASVFTRVHFRYVEDDTGLRTALLNLHNQSVVPSMIIVDDVVALCRASPDIQSLPKTIACVQDTADWATRTLSLEAGELVMCQVLVTLCTSSQQMQLDSISCLTHWFPLLAKIAPDGEPNDWCLSVGLMDHTPTNPLSSAHMTDAHHGVHYSTSPSATNGARRRGARHAARRAERGPERGGMGRLEWVRVDSVRAEREVAQGAGAEYLRLLVNDHAIPDRGVTSDFVQFCPVVGIWGPHLSTKAYVSSSMCGVV
ncbi:hypothetical protein Pelo_13533 [Pelomyxa schiedti]|nr:hypothetical protein Pelo_13533 [Pelomyxa schiedti]